MNYFKTRRVIDLNLRTTASRKRRHDFLAALAAAIAALILMADGYLLGQYFAKQDALYRCQQTSECLTVARPSSANRINNSQGDAQGNWRMFDRTYSHDVLRLSFSYPSEWGEVKLSEEYGQNDAGQKVIAGGILSFVGGVFGDDEVVFMHATNMNSMPATRAKQYWGTEGERIKSDEDIFSWCTGLEKCETFVNNSGLVIAQTDTEIQLDDESTSARRTYFLNNPYSGYSGVVFSSDGLRAYGIDDFENIFFDMVNTVAELSAP
ncbi:MAG: hypothetical protein V1738_01975 [Patescibacteria group bacterium]